MHTLYNIIYKLLDFDLKNLKGENLLISLDHLLRYPVTLVITNKHLLSSLNLLISASDQRKGPIRALGFIRYPKAPLRAISPPLSQRAEPRAALPGDVEPHTSLPASHSFFPPTCPTGRRAHKVLSTSTALLLGHPCGGASRVGKLPHHIQRPCNISPNS